MATASPGQPAGQTGLSYDRVKAALERVNNLEELCHVLASQVNIQVEPDVEAVVKLLLGMELLTWRYLIYWLDEASETEAAETLFGFAEPLADPTLTVRDASTVLHKVEDWRRVMGLLVPRARLTVLDQLHSADEQRKSATIEHYVGIYPTPSWEELACALYECEETEAVAALKTRFPNEKECQFLSDTFNMSGSYMDEAMMEQLLRIPYTLQQFHEVLPDFLPGIDALLLVHNASQPLDHCPEVELYEKNKRVGSCRSPLTNLQIIQRCLQTVQAQLVRGQCPVIVFVGTHGDLEQSWPEAREVKNAKLMELLTPEIAKRVIFFGQSLKEPLCVINAKTPGPKDKQLAIDLRKVIEKHSPATSHLIPLQKLGLVQALHGLAKDLGRGILSKEECLEVALTLQFTLESLENALQYLGELKQLHYYTFLPNVVFTDSQVLLDKISELVRFHYCIREAPSSSVLTGGRLKKFRDQGIISLDLLKEEQFSAHYIPNLFGPEQLLLVLEKLLLVAKVSDEDYLMPCLLPHAEGERIAQSPSSSVSPLLVHFPGGPRLGVFCHLLAYLLKEAKWELVYEDRKPMLVNRNSVAFALPDLPCQVTLSDPFLSHFHVSVSSDFSEEFPSACPQIREKILAGIVQVCANLGYSDCVPVDAFSCSAEGSCRRSSPHPATVMPGSSRKFLTCTLNKGTQTRISKQELVWFPTAVNSAPSRGDTPTLPLLICFPAKTTPLNIPRLLGTSYAMLGPLLLQDTSGSRIAALEAEHQRNADRINLAVMQEWLDGGGLRPVTWATLTRAMTDVGQTALAQQISETLDV